MLRRKVSEFLIVAIVHTSSVCVWDSAAVAAYAFHCGENSPHPLSTCILLMPPQTPPQRNEIVDWYQSIPPITKAIFTISMAATVAPALGLLDPFSLVLSWNAVSKLQVGAYSSHVLSHSCFLFHYSYGDW